MYIALIIIAYRLYKWCLHHPWVGSLNTRYVLITGCDSGFGKSTARSLCARGVHVFAGCLTGEGARNLREETADRVHTIILDVTSTESIQAAYDEVKRSLPPEAGIYLCSTDI